MRNFRLLTSLLLSFLLFQSVQAQTPDTSFFPDFVPYQATPILQFGDGLPTSPWNDPTVLKENNQYIMYTSGAEGGITHPNDTLGIYRWLSSDGYNWSLNPSGKVLKAQDGSYFQGGVETPSVVFFNGEYHMYNTVYSQNIPSEFRISHATSTDGLSWQVDSSPILAPSSSVPWMSEIVAEPGAMVKNDTLFLFFSATAFNGEQSIGLARSVDGSSFFDTLQAVTLPSDVYLPGNNYAGLSTPSATLVGDTIYLFTDVAQFVLGTWTQVALHQFKSYGDLNKWYHDPQPIHTQSDFSWTDGNYLSEIRSIAPLLDGNKLRIWYAGNSLAHIDTILNDTTYFAQFVGNELHPDSGRWGIGTSEYEFLHGTGVNSGPSTSDQIAIYYYQNRGYITLPKNDRAHLRIYTTTGQLLKEESFTGFHEFRLNYSGLIFIQVESDKDLEVKKAFSLGAR